MKACGNMLRTADTLLQDLMTYLGSTTGDWVLVIYLVTFVWWLENLSDILHEFYS